MMDDQKDDTVMFTTQDSPAKDIYLHECKKSDLSNNFEENSVQSKTQNNFVQPCNVNTQKRQISINNSHQSINSDVEIVDTSNKLDDNISEISGVNNSHVNKEFDSENADSLTVFNESLQNQKSYSSSSFDSFTIFKKVKDYSDNNSQKLISPISVTSKVSQELFDNLPLYSTPKDSGTKHSKTSESNIKLDSSEEPLDSKTTLQMINKKFVLLLEISSVLHFGKENLTGELVKVSCENFEKMGSLLSCESGHLSDISKSTSPGSVTSNTLPIPYKLNRYSQVSYSSSSSGASSASALALRMLQVGKLFSKKEEYKLSEERINYLKETWLNSNEIYKAIDFIDRVVNSDFLMNEETDIKLKTSLDSENSKIPQKLSIIKEVDSSALNYSTSKSKRPAKVKFISDSENELPKKKRQRFISSDDLHLSNFCINDVVFAKWSDRKFYAGTIVDHSQDGKWIIQFFDGDKKASLDEHMIKANEFTLVGHNVYASQGDNHFSHGIITGCEFKNDQLHYIVARDKGDISVPPDFLYITESQARQIRANFSNNSSKNIKNCESANGKRFTRSKTKSIVIDNSKPSSSGIQRVLSDSDDDGNESGDDVNMDEVIGVEPESHGVYENGIKVKGKSVSGKMRFAQKKMADVDADILGPLPEKGSKFFRNFHVLLTCTRPNSPKFKGSEANSSSTENCTDNEFYKFSNIPFEKNRLQIQLELGGAIVYTQLVDIPQKFWKNTYLISNRPSTSAKYIQCIAAGIKFICHEWVIRCCIEKKKLPIQELPLGWSLERKRFLSSFERTKLYPLRRQKLLIVDIVDKNYFRFWTKICKIAGAIVNKLTQDSNLENITAVICECGYRDNMVERATSYNVPVVTSTWIVQTLIHGEIRPFEGHKRYFTEYVESD